MNAPGNPNGNQQPPKPPEMPKPIIGLGIDLSNGDLGLGINIGGNLGINPATGNITLQF